MPSLRTYLRLDLENEWGSASFVAAVLERLDATPADVAINDQHRSYVDGMLSVARHLTGTGPGDEPVVAG